MKLLKIIIQETFSTVGTLCAMFSIGAAFGAGAYLGIRLIHSFVG